MAFSNTSRPFTIDISKAHSSTSRKGNESSEKWQDGPTTHIQAVAERGFDRVWLASSHLLTGLASPGSGAHAPSRIKSVLLYTLSSSTELCQGSCRQVSTPDPGPVLSQTGYSHPPCQSAHSAQKRQPSQGALTVSLQTPFCPSLLFSEQPCSLATSSVCICSSHP